MSRFVRHYCALGLMVIAGSGCGVETDGGGPPWTCPLWPVYDTPYGTVYYCDYFENSCDDEPEATYALGTFDWPQECPDCQTDALVDEAAQVFRGLDEPISADWAFRLPDGPARRLSQPSDRPDLRFIRFKDVHDRTVTAKVFAFTVEPQRALGKRAKNGERTILVAIQMEGEPANKPTTLKCKPLDARGNCCVYSAMYEPGVGERFPVLVLTAK